MKHLISKTNAVLLLIAVAGILMLLSFTPPENGILGKWSMINLDGTTSKEYVDFNKDSTYEVALPDGQIGEHGYYLLKDSTFSIKNIKDVCGKDYWGTYRLTFHGEDSIHFAVISDTCSARRYDMVGYNPWLRRNITR